MVGRTDLGCRSCCTACVYESSDGNIYADDFSGALDADWQADADVTPVDTLQVNTGQLLATAGAGKPDGSSNTIEHAADNTPPRANQAWSGILLIVEVDLYSTVLSVTSGLSLVIAQPAYSIYASLVANWKGGSYTFDVVDSTGEAGTQVVFQAPADGDKLTIILQHLTGTTFRICGFVNEEPIGELEVVNEFWQGSILTLVTAKLVYTHDTATVGEETARFDNYSFHRGNP